MHTPSNTLRAAALAAIAALALTACSSMMNSNPPETAQNPAHNQHQ